MFHSAIVICLIQVQLNVVLIISKTEMILFAYPSVKLPVHCIAVGAEYQQPAGQVRNIGVTLDEHLNTEAHIKRVHQVSYIQLKTIRTVQTCFSPEPLKD